MAEKLLEGLEDGSIVLDNDGSDEATPPVAGELGHAWVAAADGPRLDTDSAHPMPRIRDARE